MAWIEMVAEDEATGLVKEIYAPILRSGGPDRTSGRGDGPRAVTEVVKVFSLRPDLLQARRLFRDTMTFGGSGLGRYREELIAVSLSATLRCRY